MSQNLILPSFLKGLRYGCFLLAVSGTLLVLTSLVDAPSRAEPATAWQVEKCARYGKAWKQALQRHGSKGLSSEFLTRHQAFLASGCLEGRNVCPRSGEELALANVMIIAAMNGGTASTFPPFACKD